MKNTKKQKKKTNKRKQRKKAKQKLRFKWKLRINKLEKNYNILALVIFLYLAAFH